MGTAFSTLITKNVILGWLWRRVQELASWAFGLLPLYLALPQTHQELIVGILQGKGGGYTMSAYAGLAWYLWTQWQSYRATVKPQIVTEDGKKIATEELPANKKTYVEEAANVVVEKKKAERKPGLLDFLFGK